MGGGGGVSAFSQAEENKIRMTLHCYTYREAEKTS